MWHKPSAALFCVTSLILVPTTSKAQDTVKQNQAMLYGYSWGQSVYAQSMGNPTTGIFWYTYILNQRYWYTISPYKSYFNIGFNSGWLRAANQGIQGGIPKSGFYMGKISGNNANGTVFNNIDVCVVISPTVTSVGTTNGVNGRDILILTENPFTSAKAGNIIWGTNSQMSNYVQPIGNYSNSQIDTVSMNIDTSKRQISMILDPNYWASSGFGFSNGSNGILGNVYVPMTGNCVLQFSPDGKTLDGSINFSGKALGYGTASYIANMKLTLVQ